jgi:hypothetical protein
LEAKWFYNYLVAGIENRLNKQSEKLKEVEIKTPNGFERRKLKILGSQIKQGIIERIKDNLKALKKLRKQGYKVGRLQFKSDFRSIPLKQFGNTYKIDFGRNRIKIQGIKKWFRVLGLHQIPKNADIANAYLESKIGTNTDDIKNLKSQIEGLKQELFNLKVAVFDAVSLLGKVILELSQKVSLLGGKL